jgi:hypothetical protein
MHFVDCSNFPMTPAQTALSATPLFPKHGHGHIVCNKGPLEFALHVRVSFDGMEDRPSTDQDALLSFYHRRERIAHMRPFGDPVLHMGWNEAQTPEGRAKIMAETEIHERDLAAVFRWNESSVNWHQAHAPRGMKVFLSNSGHPEYRQKREEVLPNTVSDFWARVGSLHEAGALSHDYIKAYGLRFNNWSGGLIQNEDGEPLAQVDFNGRVHTLDKPLKLLEHRAPDVDFITTGRDGFFALKQSIETAERLIERQRT